MAERILFQTTPLWRAFLTTDENGVARAEIPFPDNLTTWRLTVRAVDPDTRIGEGTDSTATKRLLVARASLPVFLISGDEAIVPLIAHNFLPQAADVTVSLSASSGLAILGDKTQKKTIPAGGKDTMQVRVAAQRSGSVEIKADVKTQAEGDVLVSRLPINPHGILKSVSVAGALVDKKTDLDADTLSLPEGVRLDEAKLTVLVTLGYADAIRAALPTMMDYPYGCAEQTLSRFVPNIVAHRAFKTLRMKAFDEAKVRENADAGLAKLAALQQPDGGWGWQPENASDPFMTAYAVCGLAVAREQGFPVDEPMTAKGVDCLNGMVRANLDYPSKAYVLYALSRAGAITPADVDRHFDRQDRLKADPYTLSLLLLSYAKLKRPAEVNVLAKEIEKSAVEEGKTVHWGDPSARRWSRDDVETTAMAARALIAADPKNPLIESAFRYLLGHRQGGAWRSTRDSAAVVTAFCDYMVATRQTGEAVVALAVEVNGKARQLTAGDPASPLSLVFSGPDLRHGANTVIIQTGKPTGLFYSAHLSFFTAEKEIKAAEGGFSVSRSYARLKQEKRGDEILWTPEPLQGPVTLNDLVLVTVTVTAKEAQEFVMMLDRPPASSDPVRKDRGYKIVGVPDPNKDVHREFHLDHVAFFLNRMSAGEHSFRYIFRPTLAGRFSALPATAELMYYPEVRGNSDEEVFEVE